MIDIHSHVLPFVDDGAPSEEVSVTLLKNAVAEGVTDLFCTPHYRGNYKASAEEIKDRFEKLKARAAAEGLPIRLYLGQEIFVKEDIKGLLASDKVLTMNGTKFVLVEFDLFTRSEIVETVYELKHEGYKPIVAHLERYGYADIDDAYEIKKSGGFIQVNAASIVGDGKKAYAKFIKSLFAEGYVDFVASDVHLGRQNGMKDAYAFVRRKFGEDAAEVVFNYSGRQLIK